MPYLVNLSRQLYHIPIIAFAIISVLLPDHNALVLAQSKNEENPKCILNGTLIDSLSGKPVEIANIMAVSLEDSARAYGAVSAADGRFGIANLQPGEYEVRISRLGYRTRMIKNVGLTPDNINLDLGIISLTQETITLDGVTVTAPKPPVVFDLNKIILNPQLENGNNMLEQLENAPFVSINFDGRLSIGGMDAIRIYIDGHPAAIYGIQQTDDLRSILLYEIERIEIITGPTSEFPDASSDKIINIVTKKGLSNKYSANVSGGITSRWNLNVDTDLSVALKALIIRGDYRNSYSRFPQSSSVIKQYEMNNKSTLLEQVYNSNRKNSSNNGNISIIFRPDESSSFSNNVQYGTSYGSNTSMEDCYYKGSNGDGSYKKNISGKNNSKSFNYSSSYLGMFKNKITLDAAFSYSKGSNNFENNIQQSSISSSQAGSYGSSKMLLGNDNNTYITGIRGGFPLSADMKIFLSLDNKYAFVKRNNSSSNSLGDSSPQGGVIYPEVNYKNNECTASVGLDGMLWKINYSGSISIRNYFVNNTIGLNNYKYTNTGVDPALGLGMSITQFSRANLGYSYRICNPSNEQISPMVINIDTTNIILGNPQLKPYRVHNITINYSQLIGESFIMLSTNYCNSIGIIEPITQLITPYMSTTINQNIGSSMRYETALSGRTRMFNALDLQPSVTFSRNRYKSSYAENEGDSWYSSLQISSSILFLKVQMDLNYSSPTATAQSRYKALFYCNAAVRGKLFNNDLNFTLRVRDLFNTMHRNYDINSQGIFVKNSMHEVSRVFSLDVSYFLQSKTAQEPLK